MRFVSQKCRVAEARGRLLDVYLRSSNLENLNLHEGDATKRAFMQVIYHGHCYTYVH